MRAVRGINIAWRNVEGEGVLLDFKTGAYYSLNGVAFRIWELCDGKNNLEKIKTTIAAEYKGEPQRMTRDVEKFLTQLRKEKLVTIAS